MTVATKPLDPSIDILGKALRVAKRGTAPVEANARKAKARPRPMASHKAMARLIAGEPVSSPKD